MAILTETVACAMSAKQYFSFSEFSWAYEWWIHESTVYIYIRSETTKCFCTIHNKPHCYSTFFTHTNSNWL